MVGVSQLFITFANIMDFGRNAKPCEVVIFENTNLTNNESFRSGAYSKKQIMEILYKDESYKIVGAAMKVYNALGCGFLEAVYQEALDIQFKLEGIPFEAEKEVRISYAGVELKQTYRPDFICYDEIVIELKAVSSLDSSHRSQLYNYLKATKCKLGLLINFGNSDGLQVERKVLKTP